MKRFVVMFMLLVATTSVSAQSVEELIEAYRRGDITEAQIEDFKRQYQAQTSAKKTIKPPLNRDRAVETSVGDSVVATRRHANISAKRPSAAIFGYDFFAGAECRYEPNLTLATPKNYTLGPGDEVIIDVWGDAQSSQSYIISPDGKINVDGVGPIALSGITIEQAAGRVRRALSEIYAGLNDGTVKINLSLGDIRSIRVYVVGEVHAPGSYTVPSLATLFHIMNLAGGVTQRGSVRSIVVMRDGKQQFEVDLYDYILRGDAAVDVALQEADLVVVRTHDAVAQIGGEVRRPMMYEIREGESLADLLLYAGGFAADADINSISVVRRQGAEREHFRLRRDDIKDFILADGDVVEVGGGIDRDRNRVEVQGAVTRAGSYALGEDVNTLKELIDRAEGLRDDAYLERALLYREKDDWTKAVETIDLRAVEAGESDVVLRPNDSLVIRAISELQEFFTVDIMGSVKSPGSYPYAEGMTLQDLILAAGGMLQEASHANITITRRIREPQSTKPQEALFENFTISVTDGLSMQEREFVLKPFDEVYVRRSPVYITQSSVEVRGEVAFEGRYPLTKRNMRLSEVVGDAGGITSGAFVQGAYLLRRMTEEERVQYDALQEMINRHNDAQRIDSLLERIASDVYPVGIDLAKALEMPYSDADVVLRDGDVLAIPTYNGTVRVMGAVMYPNSVTYTEGKKMKYYISSSGGFDNKARRRHSFVIYMNGMVASGLSADIEPGCIVVVPSKSYSQPLRWNEILGLLSTTASTAAIVVSLINVAK